MTITIPILQTLRCVVAIFPSSSEYGVLISYIDIYTSSVFCYDKHKKNFDIHFSMKRHETV